MFWLIVLTVLVITVVVYLSDRAQDRAATKDTDTGTKTT